MNQKVLVRLLQQRGHSVEAVVTGQLAVEAMQRQAYDLVLMDCQMPGMDGFEATETIRRQEGERSPDGTPRRTPIVAVTASATSRDRERCLEAGMDDYISKPIDVVALDLALERWLSGAHANVERSALTTSTLLVSCRNAQFDARLRRSVQASDGLAGRLGSARARFIARTLADRSHRSADPTRSDGPSRSETTCETVKSRTGCRSAR